MKAGKIISTPFKIVLWVLAIILLILIGVNFYLCQVGLPQKAKDFAITTIEKQIGRKVEIKKLGFCILKGFVLRDLKVWDKKPFQKDIFVECKALVISYDLSELLKKKLKIKKVTLESPHIYVKRYLKNKKPVFNFSDLIPPVPEKQPVAKPEPKKEEKVVKEKKSTKPNMPKISKSQIPIDLQVEKVGLEDALIEIVDTATPRFKEIYRLENVHFLIEDIKLKENTPLKISTGFGLSVTEYEKVKKLKKKELTKTEKDINIEFAIDGSLKLFDKKGILNPSGYFILALRNGKLTGIQAYEELRAQAENINKSVEKIQANLLKTFEKIKAQTAKLEKAGKLKKYTSKAGSYIEKLNNIDTSFIKGALNAKFLAKTLEFDEIKTKVKIIDGKVITDELKADFKEFKIMGGGYTSFDTSLAYKVNLLADKKYSKNQVTKALENKDGYPEFPVNIGGTISDIKIVLEKAPILKKIQDSLKEQLMSKIRNRAGGIENLAKQMLNKYLGKYAKYTDLGTAKKSLDEAKKKAEAEAKAKLEAAKKKAEELKKKKEEEARRKAEELKKKAEAEKKKKEEEAKKKAKEALKKKFGF